MQYTEVFSCATILRLFAFIMCEVRADNEAICIRKYGIETKSGAKGLYASFLYLFKKWHWICFFARSEKIVALIKIDFFFRSAGRHTFAW